MSGILQSLSASGYAPGGGIAIVQTASGTTADGSAGLTVNFGVPVTLGNTVVALFSQEDNDVPTSVQVNNSGDLPMDSAATIANGASLRSGIYFKRLSSEEFAPYTGITYTASSPVRAAMQILEISGLADAAATDTDTASANTATPGVAGLSGNGLAIIISAYANATSAYSSGPSGGYTRIGTGTGGASVYQESYYLIGAAGASTVTLSGALDTASAGAVFGGV